MKIQLVEVLEKDESGISGYKVSIDGVIDHESQLVGSVLYIRNSKTLEKLGEFKLTQLKKYFNQIDFLLKQNITEWSVYVSIHLKVRRDSFEDIKDYKAFDVQLECVMDSKEWNKPYSLNFLDNSYERHVNKSSQWKYIPDEWDSPNGIGKKRTSK